MRQWTFDTKVAFVAALQIALDDNGAAETAPVVTNTTVATASKDIVILRMASPKISRPENIIKYCNTSQVNANDCSTEHPRPHPPIGMAGSDRLRRGCGRGFIRIEPEAGGA